LEPELEVELELTIHGFLNVPKYSSEDYPLEKIISSATEAVPKDLRESNRIRVGQSIVPNLTNLGQRNSMFAKGVYPGVEYRIMSISHRGRDIFYSEPGATYALTPTQGLVENLRREWPVSIQERDIPRIWSPDMYNLASAGLAVAFSVGSLFFSSSSASSSASTPFPAGAWIPPCGSETSCSWRSSRPECAPSARRRSSSSRLPSR